MRGGKQKRQQHQSLGGKQNIQCGAHTGAVGQAGAENIAGGHRDTVGNQHQAHRIVTEAAQFLQNGRQKGEEHKSAAIADHGERIHQPQTRRSEHGQLLRTGGRRTLLQAARNKQQAADKSGHAQ